MADFDIVLFLGGAALIAFGVVMKLVDRRQDGADIEELQAKVDRLRSQLDAAVAARHGEATCR